MLVNIWPTAELVLQKLAACKSLVYDAETSGLDWRHNHIVGHVLTFGPSPNDTFYVPVRHAPGNNLPDDIQVPVTDNGWRGDAHKFEILMIQLMEGKKIIFHNGSFDMRFLHQIGWRPSGPVEDTMIAAYLVDELRSSFSLDACCKDEKVQAKKGDVLYQHIAAKLGVPADRNSMAFYWRMDPADTPIWDYAVGDGTSTWQLREVLQTQIERPYYKTATTEYDLKRVAKVEYDLMPILHRMSMRGVKIDEQYMFDLTKKTKEKLADGLFKLNGINMRSPIQMKKYFESHGITNWPLTEKGSPSFAGEWLTTTEAGRAIVEVRKLGTLLSNFLVPTAERYIHNGRVHPEIHQTRDDNFGTKTGRLSVTGPNLSAIPGKRQGELGKTFRKMFIPEDGNMFWEADYKTCEIRICAHYCGAKLWVDGYKNGIDPHTSIYNGIPVLTALDPKMGRQHAKRINLAIMTGAGKAKIAAELGLELKEGLNIVNQYFEGLPELKKFQKQAADYFKGRGFVSTLLGRRLQLADPQKAYTAVNRLTQGGNADITKMSLIAMDSVCELNMPVHDSNLFQTPIGANSVARSAAQAMVDVCEQVGFKLPMEVDLSSGMNWGEATFNESEVITWDPQS